MDNEKPENKAKSYEKTDEPMDGRRYDSKDGGGRIVPGATIENNALGQDARK